MSVEFPPVFSTQREDETAFEFIYSKTSKAGVQEFVDGLHEKLNTIIIKHQPRVRNLPPVSLNESCPKIALSPLGRHVTPVSSDFNSKHRLELLGSDPLKDASSQEQHSSALGLAEVAVNQPHQATEPMVTSDHTVPGDIARETSRKRNSKIAQ